MSASLQMGTFMIQVNDYLSVSAAGDVTSPAGRTSDGTWDDGESDMQRAHMCRSAGTEHRKRSV